MPDLAIRDRPRTSWAWQAAEGLERDGQAENPDAVVEVIRAFLRHEHLGRAPEPAIAMGGTVL